MNRSRWIVGISIILLSAGAIHAGQAPPAELIRGLTWADPVAGHKAIDALLAQGPSAVLAVAKMLKAPGKGDDANPRFALQGMITTVTTGKDETRRVMVATALGQALAQQPDPSIKAFLIARLQQVGGDESVEVLRPYLDDQRLCPPAARALVTIGTPKARRVLREALPAARGRARLSLIQAVGVLGDTASIPLLLPLASAKDPLVRRAALKALGNTADLSARDPLLHAAASKDPLDREAACNALATLAKGLNAKGDKAAAEALGRALLALPGGAPTGLAILTDVAGAGALPELEKAIVGSNAALREAALRHAAELSGAEVEAMWAKLAVYPDAAVRGAVLRMLGARGKADSAPLLIPALKDQDPDVRAMARQALARLGGDIALDPLVQLLAVADPDEAAAIRATLRWVASPRFNTVIAAALAQAKPAGKIALLSLLAERHAVDQRKVVFAQLADPDRGVRKQALNTLETLAQGGDVDQVIQFMLHTSSASERKLSQKVLTAICRRDPAAVTPIMKAVKTSSGKQRATLLRTLGNIGGDAALNLVVAETRSQDDQVRDAAVRALAGWPDASAAEPLLAIARQTKDRVHRTLALRGYVRVVTLPSGRAPKDSAQLLAKAWAIAATDAERKLVLSGLGTVRHDDALALVAKALEQKPIQNEAAAAALAICCPKKKGDKGLLTPTAYQAMMKIVELAPNQIAVKKAEEHLLNFPVGGGVNIALGKPVKTSCPQQNGQAPWKAVDGKLGRSDAWFGDRWPSSLEVDLLKPAEINAVRVVFYWDGRRSYQYKVESSLDGKTWTLLADNAKNTKPATSQGLVHRFKPVKARYVRLTILKNSVNEAVHVVEFEVYSDDDTALKPTMKRVNDPANIALGKPVTTSIAQEMDKAPPRAVNGILEREDGWWGSGTPAWLQVDLGSVRNIDTARAIFYWDGGRYYQYRIEGSVDGKTWTVLADNSKNTTPSTSLGYVHHFKPAKARYVRLNIIKNSVNPSCHVTEFEVYEAGKAPKNFAMAEPPKAAKPKYVKAPPLAKPDKEGFIPLFNGKDLTGWMGDTHGYTVENGVMVCKEKGGGKLLTMHRFSDFVLRFDFKMPKGANNGLAVRAPAQGNPAYAGMELQIIDNKGYKEVHNYQLKPWQTHGSIYGCVPAKTGALKPVGEWNSEEVRAVGPRITVILNGKTIVDADVDALTTTADGKGLGAHPGLRRRTGYLGWLGHGARVEFRNIRVKPLHPYTEGPLNVPPKGFTALFNGKDLSGWKGLLKPPYDNPEKRAGLPPEKRRSLQAQADADMRAHWRVEDGTFVFDGKGRSLCTAKDYGDFEMYVDWKIKPMGDSGIYLRGSPQVQIWDTARWPQGSGGLYNNRKNPRDPTECADNPVGEWNRFFIRMVGERVTVYLNGVRVVPNVIMENYWNRSKPIYPTGQIELQNHGNTLWFRNIYLRELPRQKP